jgi:asparagine synthetase A
MENLYLIRKIELATTHSLGETTSETPNVFTTEEFSWEKLHEITENQLSQAKDMLKKFYSNVKFSKLVVKLTYSPKDTPELEHCIDFGFDEEGEVYCS